MQDTESLHEAAQNVDNALEATTFDWSWDFVMDKATEWGMNLITALIILIVGLMLVKRIGKLTNKLLMRRHLDDSLRSFLVSMTVISLRILVVVTALSTLGMEMTSFVALIGAAGLAVGMAFSGTLSNFAGGVMILVFRPYVVGDLIKAQGEEGIVKEIQIFNTVLLTFDNKTIIIPNGALANGNITNFTKQEVRRVDFKVGISYGDQYEVARDLLLKFISEDDRILKDPEPFIGLGELADSSVNLTLRVWAKTDDYWAVYFKMNERIYNEFKHAGLSIPFPQMDVHVHQA